MRPTPYWSVTRVALARRKAPPSEWRQDVISTDGPRALIQPVPIRQECDHWRLPQGFQNARQSPQGRGDGVTLKASDRRLREPRQLRNFTLTQA